MQQVRGEMSRERMRSCSVNRKAVLPCSVCRSVCMFVYVYVYVYVYVSLWFRVCLDV